MIDKNLSKTQTSKSPNPSQGGTLARGARQDPPSGGAKQPGRGLSNTQTRNSPSNRA